MEEKAKSAEELISNVMKKNGKKGGKTTLIKYGVNHYAEIGKKGGSKMKKVWQERKSKKVLPKVSLHPSTPKKTLT